MVRCSLPASGSSPEPVACWCNCQKNPPIPWTNQNEEDSMPFCVQNPPTWWPSVLCVPALALILAASGLYPRQLPPTRQFSPIPRLIWSQLCGERYDAAVSRRSGKHSLKYFWCWWSLNIPTGLAPKRLGRTSKPIRIWGWEYLLITLYPTIICVF